MIIILMREETALQHSFDKYLVISYTLIEMKDGKELTCVAMKNVSLRFFASSCSVGYVTSSIM